MSSFTWPGRMSLCLMACIVLEIFPLLVSSSDRMSVKKIRFCSKFRVHIIDGFSSNNLPFLLHCWSKDQDLGNHTLYIGGDFNFHFGTRFWPPYTHFNCDMSWGPKNLHDVTVFDQGKVMDWCCSSGQCYWRAQDDGLYYSNDNSTYAKKYDWK
ncbi:hypothetical protein Tsubulata_048165 [Turnera subulata]|uniref:S-protein homolog n=1 Tax=Turnera subulata TaxID=218843 RepID=A0A9Q0JM95_9ROSI|nr:hypothetical protein Tsubulata_048165 [Turnera subulata]